MSKEPEKQIKRGLWCSGRIASDVGLKLALASIEQPKWCKVAKTSYTAPQTNNAPRVTELHRHNNGSYCKGKSRKPPAQQRTDYSFSLVG